MQIFSKKPKEKSFLLRAIFLSLFLHFLFTLIIKKNTDPLKKQDSTKKPIKIKIVRQEPKRLIETIQTKTNAPINPKHYGRNNHQAKKEQVARKKPVPTVGEASQKTQEGTLDAKTEAKKQIEKQTPKEKDFLKKPDKKSLFARSLAMAKQQSLKTFQESVDDDKIPEGEILDLSTSDYRYIGYFIGLRKIITLNWVYPLSAARAGKQGKVLVVFSIERNGDVSYIKILESSGYSILDDAVIATLKESSPFAPLPENYNQKRMNVKGYFNYVL